MARSEIGEVRIQYPIFNVEPSGIQHLADSPSVLASFPVGDGFGFIVHDLLVCIGTGLRGQYEFLSL